MADGTLKKGLPVVCYHGAKKTQVQLWVKEAANHIEFLYNNEAASLSDLAADLVTASHDMAKVYTSPISSATQERTNCNKFFHLLNIAEGFCKASEQVTQTETSDTTRHTQHHIRRDIESAFI